MFSFLHGKYTARSVYNLLRRLFGHTFASQIYGKTRKPAPSVLYRLLCRRFDTCNKLRVHSQNRLSEASRYFVAHFAHVWLRHKKKKGNIPLRVNSLGMFPFFFFLSVCYILKIARASSSLPASWRRFSDETSRLFIVSLMPCAEFIVLVVEASFCSEIDARLCTTS